MWVGAEGAMESDLISQIDVSFKTIPAAGLHGVNLFKMPKNIFQLVKGYFASRKLVREFSPDVVFYTGGYVAAPVGLAARKKPIVAYVPDVEPALALQLAIRFADKIAVSIDSSIDFIQKGKDIIVTGYPVRDELYIAKKASKETCLAKFDLKPGKPVLLVTGGSLGARSINQVIVKNLASLLEKVQIIHVFGKTTWPEFETEREALSEAQKENYRAYPYLHSEDMAFALAAADLCVSRGGASTLGEYPFMELPSILVPYPHAWRYQKTNAESLASHGAAVVLEDEKLGEELIDTIFRIVDKEEPYHSMKLAMRKLARPTAAQDIADLVSSLAEKR